MKDGVVVNLEGGFGDSYNVGILNFIVGILWNLGVVMFLFYYV